MRYMKIKLSKICIYECIYIYIFGGEYIHFYKNSKIYSTNMQPYASSTTGATNHEQNIFFKMQIQNTKSSGNI